MLGHFATRLSGSSDLYEGAGRPPYSSINFVTSHDGFTLNDLVSYRDKHNEANGEGNRDGDNNNYSDNYGVEGPTRRQSIEQLRLRQVKNMLATLLLSQGVPMLAYGDECRRTQRGNNNAYCQDNEISWFDWKLVDKNEGLVRFCRALIKFRRQQPTVRQRTFLTGKPNGNGPLPDVSWYSPLGVAVDWERGQLALTALLTAPSPKEDLQHLGRDVLFLINATGQPVEFILPPVARQTDWRMFIDTSADSPGDAFPELDGPCPPRCQNDTLPNHTFRCYVARR
jgi:glycogen operon protein